MLRLFWVERLLLRPLSDDMAMVRRGRICNLAAGTPKLTLFHRLMGVLASYRLPKRRAVNPHSESFAAFADLLDLLFTGRWQTDVVLDYWLPKLAG